MYEVKRGEIVGRQKFNNQNKLIKKTYSELETEYLILLLIKGRAEYTIKKNYRGNIRRLHTLY